MSKNNKVHILKNGIINNNPVFMQVIGICPTLAVTTNAENGLGMGLATTAVLIFSNLVVSSLRKIIPGEIRIPVLVAISAGFATAIEMIIKAYFPALNNSLGLYLSLIAINCIILSRSESFALKNSPADAIFDGVGMGLGFTVVLMLIGAFREILGMGSVFGLNILPDMIPRTVIMILPPGGFFTLAVLIAVFNYIKERKTQ